MTKTYTKSLGDAIAQIEEHGRVVVEELKSLTDDAAINRRLSELQRMVRAPDRLCQAQRILRALAAA